MDTTTIVAGSILLAVVVVMILTTMAIGSRLVGAEARPAPQSIKCRGNCCKTIYVHPNISPTDAKKAAESLEKWAQNIMLNRRRDNKTEAYGEPGDNPCAMPITICAVNGTSLEYFEQQVDRVRSYFNSFANRTNGGLFAGYRRVG